MRSFLAWPLLVLSAAASNPVVQELSKRQTKRTENGVHIPIYRRETTSARKRGLTGAIGLGDYLDVAYNVLITVGGAATPVILDTGSSDLWVMSDACTTGCTGGSNIPLYPQATFKSKGLDATLLYGDSQTGTYAFGQIGTDTVNLAGLSLPDQLFASINNTNTSVLETGSAGIFGLGYSINSALWTETFVAQNQQSLPSKRNADIFPRYNYATRFFPNVDFNSPSRFPSLSNILGSSHRPQARQTQSPSSLTTLISASYATIGPLLIRLVANKQLTAPMFTVTLQRDTIDIGGNVGTLSIGELPSGVKNESLTWVPLRNYTPAQGGLPAPEDSPNEQYPIAWELFIDDVFFDGEKLPRSALAPPSLAVSALIDTGNSLIRGPSDVMSVIAQKLGGTSFPCATPHTLAFQIGGKQFPVDPRDFIRQTFVDSVITCTTSLTSTDPPASEGLGYLYSWSLGDPFLKSVLASFYYGNLSYPSQDPPRIGLLSTVPSDANDQLKAAVQAAGNNFATTVEAPPTGTFTPAKTGINGVPAASETSSGSTGGPGKNDTSNTALATSAPARGVLGSVFALALVALWL